MARVLILMAALLFIMGCANTKVQPLNETSSIARSTNMMVADSFTQSLEPIQTVVVQKVLPSQTVRFDVYVNDLSDLGGFQVDVKYDNQLLSYDHAVLGDWFNNDNTGLFLPQAIDVSSPGLVKNLVGVRTLGLKGSGRILSVYFTVLQAGTPSITVSNILLSTGQGKSIDTANIKTSSVTSIQTNDQDLTNKTLLVTTGIQNTSSLYLDTAQEFLATTKAIVGSDGPININYIPKTYSGPVNIYLFSDAPDITFSDLSWYNPQTITHQATYQCPSPAWYVITPTNFSCYLNDTQGSNSALGLPSKDPKNDKVITKLLFTHDYDSLDTKTNTFTYTVSEQQTWQVLTTTLQKAPSTLQNMKYSYVYKAFNVTSNTPYEFKATMHIPFSQSRTGSYYIGIEEQNNTGITILDPWYNTSWAFRQNITINASEVNATHLNFTLSIHLDTDTSLASNALANGSDIVFVNSSGTKLDHEIELYNSTSGQLVAWIRIPRLDNLSNTTISMYYGNPTASDQQNKNGVWDSQYTGVWHLSATPAVFLNDSTTNGFNGTNNGVLNITGQLDGGANFSSAATQYASMSNPAGLNIGATDFTISYWFNASSAAQYGPIVSKRGLAPDGFIQYQTGIGSVQLGTQTPGTVLFFFGYNGLVFQSYFTTNGVVDNNWHYAVFTRTSGVIGITVDGNVMALSTADLPDTSSDDFTNSQNFNLGFQNSDQYFNGKADEVHLLTKLARNTSWIMTEYNNQRNATTFLSLGPQEAFATPMVCNLTTVSGVDFWPCGCDINSSITFAGTNKLIINGTGESKLNQSKPPGKFVTSQGLNTSLYCVIKEYGGVI